MGADYFFAFYKGDEELTTGIVSRGEKLFDAIEGAKESIEKLLGISLENGKISYKDFEGSLEIAEKDLMDGFREKVLDNHDSWEDLEPEEDFLIYQALRDIANLPGSDWDWDWLQIQYC